MITRTRRRISSCRIVTMNCVTPRVSISATTRYGLTNCCSPICSRSHFWFDEYQHPMGIGAWRHEWSRGVHALLLGGRLENEQRFTDQAVPEVRFETFGNGALSGIFLTPFDLTYHNRLEIYTAEA